MKQPVSLIFDIGKTAKKVILFDSEFHVVEEQVEHFAESKDDDGFPSENLALVSEWVRAMVEQCVSHPKYDITHVNFSAYGASLVHLDENDGPLPSFYNYLKSFPEKHKEEFFNSYDGGGNILASTASPWLGMLNSGLQLFWMKRSKPEVFRKIKTSLHLPQYFTQLLSGKKFCEITSVGCHTMLWDFTKKNYHEWVDKEQLTNLFPSMQLSDHSFPLVYGQSRMTLGVGVHDSSAALMPYLATMHDPFLLLSTGTWNITFNPFDHSPLTQAELKRDCLCYITYTGNPVKASRIFLGHEHEVQVNAIRDFFKEPNDFHTKMKFNEQVYGRLAITHNTSKVIYPMSMEGSGPLPEKQVDQTNWQSFDTAEEAYHQLVRHLVKWQMMSVNLVNPQQKIKNLIVVGGFTKNPIFLEILKREAKQMNILLSDHPRAAALGAAWLVCGKEAYNGKKDLLNVVAL